MLGRRKEGTVKRKRWRGGKENHPRLEEGGQWKGRMRRKENHARQKNGGHSGKDEREGESC
jgi:hypothetical protein